MDNFLLKVLISAIAIAIFCAPIGSLLLWKKMAFLGDTIAHSALFGAGLALILHVPVELGALILTVSIASIMALFDRRFSNDTTLGIVAYGSLALAMVIVSFAKIRIDLYAYMFGDILAVNNLDVICLYGLGAVILTWVKLRWNKLLLITICPDLAAAQHINVKMIELELRLVIAILIALSMKIVGVLLITALLIIPPATARFMSNTPERMVMLSAIIGIISAIGGIYGSFKFDIPCGPAIIVCTLIGFAITRTCVRWRW